MSTRKKNRRSITKKFQTTQGLGNVFFQPNAKDFRVIGYLNISNGLSYECGFVFTGRTTLKWTMCASRHLEKHLWSFKVYVYTLAVNYYTNEVYAWLLEGNVNSRSVTWHHIQMLKDKSEPLLLARIPKKLRHAIIQKSLKIIVGRQNSCCNV